MSEKKQQEAITETELVTTDVSGQADNNSAADVPAEGTPVPLEEVAKDDKGGKGMRERRNPRRPRRGGRREERTRPEFDQKIISIRRVTRVMAGGRRFNFSVAMVIGDRKGKVGVGIGKAGDTQLAIEKAIRDAKKHMIVVPMNEKSQISHDVSKKYASSDVMIMPAPGRGLVAGSSVRTVLEMAGVKDVTAKLLSRSKNKLNNARAAVEALKQLKGAS
jgi:small subunit ribosomal protein S5